MKVTKRQLETIVRKALLEQNVGTVNVEFSDGGSEESNEAHHNEEEDLSETDDEESTIKYNANPALQGDQTTLPDALQKGIIDKAKKKSKNENTMRITKKQLRKIIKEYKEMLRPGHVDGHPWSGTLEDLATVQSKTWGHGNIVDPKGYKEIVNSARDLTAGKAKSPLKKHGK